MPIKPPNSKPQARPARNGIPRTRRRAPLATPPVIDSVLDDDLAENGDTTDAGVLDGLDDGTADFTFDEPTTEDTPTAEEASAPSTPVPVSATPLDAPVAVFQAGLERRKRNRASLLDWVRSALVDGTDYGRLHVMGKDRCAYAKSGQAARCQDPNHWSKPSLFKPGAEKICGLLGVTVHFPSLPSYEETAWSGQPLPVIVLRCELRDGLGRAVAEGIGARILQQDYGDLNKALKMAAKSAHIDATLRLAGLSEVFTQDLEDTPPVNEKVSRARSEPPPENGSDAEPAVVRVSRAQLRYLDQRLTALGLERDRVLRWIRRASRGQMQTFQDLTPDVYEKLLPKLERWARADANGNGHGNGTQNGHGGAKPENGRAARIRRT